MSAAGRIEETVLPISAGLSAESDCTNIVIYYSLIGKLLIIDPLPL